MSEQEVHVKAEERTIWEMMVLAENQFSDVKRENAMRVIQIYLEALKRCPSLAAMPMEEKKELIQILRENDIL